MSHGGFKKSGEYRLLVGDLEDEADEHLADWMKSPDLGRRVSTRSDYKGLREACLVVNKSDSSSVADLLSLVRRGVEAISRAGILEVHVGALESSLLCSNMRIGELESQLGSESSMFEAAAAKLESIKRHGNLAEDAASLVQEQVLSQRAQLCREGVTRVAAKVAQAAAKASVRSATALKLALQDELAQWPGV